MRLPEDQVKEALLHPDLDVRDAAIGYFHRATSPGPGVMPLAIQAIERYGRTQAFTSTHHLNELPQTEQTVGWVLAELQRDLQERPEDVYFYHLGLSRLLCHADVGLVARHAPEILRARHFAPSEQPAFQERLEMCGWTAAKCWQELRQFCEANRDKDNFEEFDHGHAFRIVETLAGRAREYEGQVVALLSEEVRDYRHDGRKWLQPMMAVLAGEMRLQAAIPLLVRNLGHAHSYLADQSLFALAQLGGDDVVAAVCEPFPRASRDFRLWAGELLGKIHRDVVVGRVLELLAGERDPAVRGHLCEALLAQFCSEGVEPARRLIQEPLPTSDLRHLRGVLVATCKVLGVRFPEFDAWHEESRRDGREERLKIKEIEKLTFEAGGDLGLLAETLEVRRLKAQLAELQRKEKRLRAEKQRLLGVLEVLQSWAEPARPDRVGRNDPCPCGSGKKFKQCCLRR